MSSTRRAVLSAVVLALVARRGVSGPQEAPAVFGVDVQLVAVPVFVTDKDGKAVPGLTAQDFEVEDGGRAVPVTGFLTVDAGTPSVLPSGGSPRLIAASRRQFLLLFDQTFSSPSGILKARKAALELLENGPQPGDLVSVASFGLGGVSVLIGFTQDRVQAARAVAMLGGGDTTRLRDPLGLAYDLGFKPLEGTGKFGLVLEEGMGGDDNRQQVLLLARAERAQYRQRVVGYVGELQRLAQLLDSVQGRKQVILLSAGFDDSVFLGAQGTEQAENARAVLEGRIQDVQGDRHFGDTQARSVLDGLYQALARSDTVVHTVNVAGLAAGGSLEDTGSVPTGSGRGSLSELAGRSGGRFVKEGNDLAAAMREVLDASRYYYVLAFEPGDSKRKPGELRKIKIKARRSGLEVSHRAGYTVPDPKTAVPGSTRLQAAEVIAKGLSGGALRLRAVAVPYRSAKGQVSLPVVLEIDGESLLAGAGKKALSLEIYGYAFDGEGRVQDAVALNPTLQLEQVGASVRQKGVQVLTAFRVREGPADLRFLVRDPASGRTGSLRVTSTVPAFGAALVVSPPLLMDDPRARVVIATPSQANPDFEIPFRLEDTPFTPQAGPVLHNGEAREVCLMAFGGVTGASSPLKADLIGADGKALAMQAGASRLVKDADRFRRLVVSLTPKDVPPGDYRLRLTLQDSPDAVESRSELAVRVN